MEVFIFFEDEVWVLDSMLVLVDEFQVGGSAGIGVAHGKNSLLMFSHHIPSIDSSGQCIRVHLLLNLLIDTNIHQFKKGT